MSTILDVEKLSGVSKSTISRYLRGQNIREDKKILIDKAIEELNYRLNPMASGLKTNKTMTIGIVLPRLADPFFPPIIKEIESELRELGYRTLISNYDDDIALEIKQMELMRQYRVDGIILATDSRNGEHIKSCLNDRIPVVLIDRLIDGLDCDSVCSDNYQATFDALNLAIRKGHRKIAILRGQDNVYTDRIRYKAYLDVLKYHGIPINENYIATAGISNHDASREFMRLLDCKDPATLIFASNLHLALGAIEAIIEYNVKVPDEVSVLNFDRLTSFPYMNFVKSIKPELSSIQQQLEIVAEEAVALLMNRIKIGFKNYKAEHITVKASIIMTESIKNIIEN